MTEVHQVDGTSVTMPVRVRDARAATVLFDIAAAAAGELVPAQFEVVEAGPGRAQLALALVDYRDNDLGSYREVGVMFFVRPQGGGPDGTYLRHLPVDQHFTCVAGRQIWGFPKTVEQIDVQDAVQDGSGSSTWTLTMDGDLVLRLTVPVGGSDELPALPMQAYTLLDGRPHTTLFTQQAAGVGVRFGPDGVQLELGSHPVAKELAGLGLPAPASMSTWMSQLRATFEQPQPL